MTKKRGWPKGKKRGPMSEAQKDKLRVERTLKLLRQNREKPETKEEEKVYGKKYRQDKYGQYDVYRYE